MKLQVIDTVLKRCIYCGYATRMRINNAVICAACDRKIDQGQTLTYWSGI